MPGPIPFRRHQRGPGRGFNADRLNTDAGPLPGHSIDDLHSDSVQYQGPAHFQAFVFIPVIATVAAVSLAWLPPQPANAQAPHFQQALSADPVPTTLGTLPTLPEQLLTPVESKVQPPRFNKDSVEAPPYANFVSPFTIASWKSTDGSKRVDLRYEQGNYVAQVRPTLATLATLLALTPTDIKSQPQRYDQGSYINQVAPTLATLPVFLETLPISNRAWQSWPLEWADGDILTEPVFAPATPAVTFPAAFVPNTGASEFQKFASGEFIAPPIANFVSPFTLSSWTPTVGQKNLPPVWQRGDTFSAPDKFNIIAPAISFPAAWIPNLGVKGQPLDYALSDLVQSPFANFVSPFTFSSWQPTIGDKSKPSPFTPGDIFTAPAKFAIISPATTFLPGWFGTDGLKAQPARYQPGAWTAPDKMSAAVFTISSWLSTDGPRCQPQDYMQPAIAAPDNSTLVKTSFLAAWTPTTGVAAQPADYFKPDSFVSTTFVSFVSPFTIAGWTPTVGQNRQPVQYSATSWTAPDKMTGIAPAVPNIAMWSPTLGLKRQPARIYPSFVTDFPFNPQQGPFVLVAALDHRTYSALQANHQTYSQFESIKHQTYGALQATHTTYSAMLAIGHTTYSATLASGQKIVGLD